MQRKGTESLKRVIMLLLACSVVAMVVVGVSGCATSSPSDYTAPPDILRITVPSTEYNRETLEQITLPPRGPKCRRLGITKMTYSYPYIRKYRKYCA